MNKQINNMIKKIEGDINNKNTKRQILYTN